MPWNKDVKKIPTDATDRFQRRRNQIVVSTLTDIVMSSPVDTGRFRGNHTVTRNGQPPVSEARKDKNGQPTIQRGVGAIQQTIPFTLVYIASSVHYANKLEKGFSPQAPKGIIGPAYRRLLARFGSGAT